MSERSESIPIIQIGPSILNADLSSLSDECQSLIAQGADYLHLDVMDGSFVPEITFGPPVVKCLRDKVPGTYLDAHMMVQHPLKWVKSMSNAGVNQYTFHLESSDDPYTVINLIRDTNMKVGLAINPKTKVEKICQYIDKIDVVLIMTVEPGYGGQKFMHNMLSKIEFLRSRYPYLDIEVDGGVNTQTVEQCSKAGANMIVAGTSIIKSQDRAQVILDLKESCRNSFKYA